MFVLIAALMLALIGGAFGFVVRLTQIDADTIEKINVRARDLDQRDASRTGRRHEDGS
ncbi:hypothetical protein [Protofrankia symbiont of Coriaria ruscifolia]|uniref:Putative membrane protein n=1 Tax=Candidatus Protofrankia californiensis TaxID=1839754 RepID=A0A1C3PBY1_9ACTN|nr:hypothetical protein [Protofrankia symbiont of Coriaria ruscifolia]SBW27319.1 putative membrane protein [Candidatus Protofrankia californiensis]